MERTITYTISANEHNLSVKTFLKQRGYSAQNLIELKKIPESIQVNGCPVFTTHTLREGDSLRIHIAEPEASPNIVPVPLPLDVVYEDEDILVVNKPAGMPIHPSQNNYDNSLANAVAYYYADQNIPFVFRCVNRLDKDTSGLTVIAKHIVSAGILSAMIASKKEAGFGREYRAIVRGNIEPARGTINVPIRRKDDSVIERIADPHKGDPAVTHYQTLETKNGYSLISLVLETGRTHQIRVHMKYLGFPLIGDYLYNPDTSRMTRQALHAYKLDFEHPITGQPMSFTAPLPEDMRWML